MHSPGLSHLLTALKQGAVRIGEISITHSADIFALHHHLDQHTDNLEVFSHVTDARKIAATDAAGKFRPLRSAPNLRQGWLLQLTTSQQLLLATNTFYPAALALAAAHRQTTLVVTPLRETLDRQSGMYRVTRTATGTQIANTITDCCNSATGCLRHRLWTEDSPPLNPGDRKIPLLCREACNLLVAALRERIKGDRL